jgi:hypothetical protein
MSRYQKRFVSIEEMEAIAKASEDVSSIRRIGEHWLECKFELGDRDEDIFRFYWKAEAITRKVAVEIMERACEGRSEDARGCEMTEHERLLEIARGNIERHLGDVCEGDDSADSIFDEAYTLAFDALA